MVGYRGVGVGPPVRADGRGKGEAKGRELEFQTGPLFFSCQKAKRSIEKTNGVTPVKLLNFLVFE